ncbi:putative secreted protein [Wickerhamomyces ciferrii]|uniref:Secreted protein n=1 Tax=Wickerhamomyces ciferrii (strain ATCC 14091 / BCRC 22168 / CBS 111 / JCM 3599 / NBRC 0793 / NRRL Y-1031 F-60-10) TaxID=1206466 RepID=K0KWL7_WICCF|nr:uncharacterized protein BN7_6006 [Wickerhamomyces ciferrii]CCH46412.1 putative secreted protein [Wickerhamomyces ciferrii]
MQLTKLVSIVALTQLISTAPLDQPIHPGIPLNHLKASGEAYTKVSYAADYTLTFQSGEISKNGEIWIDAKIDDTFDKNQPLVFANETKISNNLKYYKTPGWELYNDNKTITSFLKFNGDREEVSFSVRGLYGDSNGNVTGTFVKFNGFYRPEGASSAVEIPFNATATLERIDI